MRFTIAVGGIISLRTINAAQSRDVTEDFDDAMQVHRAWILHLLLVVHSAHADRCHQGADGEVDHGVGYRTLVLVGTINSARINASQYMRTLNLRDSVHRPYALQPSATVL